MLSKIGSCVKIYNLVIIILYLVLESYTGYFNHYYFDLPSITVIDKNDFAVQKCFVAVLAFRKIVNI